MEKIIQNQPNDLIGIICTIKPIDSNYDNYALIPQEVAIGKVDDSNTFTAEDTGAKYLEVSRFEETYMNEHESKYFAFPMELSELKRRYPDKTTSTELMVAYYREIRKNIHLIYRTETSEEVTIETVVKRDKEDLRKLNEKIEKEYHEKQINFDLKESEKQDIADLSSIKRRALATYLKERILMNDSLMDDIATVIVANFRTTNPRLMKNLLCVGPTGSGKSETFKLIAEYADLPFTIYDCTKLTAEGFVGNSVEDIFKDIYSKSGGNLIKASRSILLLDEIDKLASRGDPIKDIDVQQSLLKLLEGFNFSFENKRGNGQIHLDTTFITKIGAGAFNDLFDKNKQKHGIGFGAKDEVLEEKQLIDSDIIDFGFIPEFVARFPLIYTYKPLDLDGLRLLLTKSKISPLVQEKERLLEEYGCTIEYDTDFLDEIIDSALKTEAGGRSLSKIITNAFIKLEGAMIDEIDDSHEIPKTLKLKKEMVKNPEDFNL